MTETRELICINCPLGCGLTVTLKDAEVVKVEGNTCPKGEAYGKKEVTNPTRIVTSTVRVSGGVLPVVSVKTASDIPKEKIMDCANVLKNVKDPGAGIYWRCGGRRRMRHGSFCHSHEKYFCSLNQRQKAQTDHDCKERLCRI